MRVRLGDITKVKTGKLDANASCINGKYPFFTCSKQSLKIDSYSYDCECVLVAGNGDLNVKYYKGKFDAYQRTYIIEDDSDGKLYMPYLYYFMENYVDELRSQAIGGVIKYIKLGNITDAIINLPPIDKQKEIVIKLKKTENITDSKKKQLELLDELVKARFVEMFGDPFVNEKKWPVLKIKDIVTDVRYGTSKPATENGKYKYLRMNNITFEGKLDFSDLKYIDLDEVELEKCVVRKGDILFNRTNSIDLIGKTTDFDYEEEMVIAGYIIRLRLTNRVLPKFFSYYMNNNSMKKHLKAIAKGAVNQANINAQELQAIRIYLPPLPLQNQFADFVRETDKSRLVNIT